MDATIFCGHEECDMEPCTRAEAVCACGARRYASEAEARKAEPDGNHKCPTCETFALDHRYWEGGEGRCGDCDTRYHSHGGPQ